MGIPVSVIDVPVEEGIHWQKFASAICTEPIPYNVLGRTKKKHIVRPILAKLHDHFAAAEMASLLHTMVFSYKEDFFSTTVSELYSTKPRLKLTMSHNMGIPINLLVEDSLFWKQFPSLPIATNTEERVKRKTLAKPFFTTFHDHYTPAETKVVGGPDRNRLYWRQYYSRMCSQLTHENFIVTRDAITIVRPIYADTFTQEQTFESGNTALLSPIIVHTRNEGLLDSNARKRNYYTQLPYRSRNIIPDIERTWSSETKVAPPHPPSLFEGSDAPELSTNISTDDLPKYRLSTKHVHLFKTFLREYDSVYMKIHREPSFLVVSPNQLMAYPTILPVFRNYGLQLIEPHYVFTAYLDQNPRPIYFFRRKGIYKASSQSYVMRPKFFKNVVTSILNDQSKLRHGYVLSGLDYSFRVTHRNTYQIIRTLMSSHHQPSFIIYIMIPDDYLYMNLCSTMGYDPTTNYTILMYNYSYFKETIADKYFEGRILEEDRVPRHAPFCYTIDNGSVDYALLLEWKNLNPKTIMIFHTLKQIYEEEVATREQTGMAPDCIILFTIDEYKIYYDVSNSIYERIYVSTYTKTFPTMTFYFWSQPVDLNSVLAYFRTVPTAPMFSCSDERTPNAERKFRKLQKAQPGRWYLRLCWGRDLITDTKDPEFGIRGEYYETHVDEPMPSLEKIRRAIDTGVKRRKEKLNLKDVEGRIEYFKNIKRLPDELRDLKDGPPWSRICPVGSIDEAMLIRGHYQYRLRYGEAIYVMKSRVAVYKLLNNPMYQRLDWAWWTSLHFVVSGQPLCGVRYVSTALSLIIKAPHIFFDPIFSAAVIIKRYYNYIFFLESCWRQIYYYKFATWAEFEKKRFKSFLPWATRKVRKVRAKVGKGMDDPEVNEYLRYQCFHPYRRLARGQRLRIFPLMDFDDPNVEPKYIKWEEPCTEGFVRMLDLMIMYTLNMECSPLFLMKLIFTTPDYLLPEKFILTFPREVFATSNILHEWFFRPKEPPRALEEVRILCQAIFQAIAKRGNIPGEGWVVSGTKVFPRFLERLNELGVPHKVFYIQDPTFYLFRLVHSQKTLQPSVQLARELSYCTRYMDPEALYRHQRKLEDLNIQIHLFSGYKKCVIGDPCGCIESWFKKRKPRFTPKKCICDNNIVAYTYFRVCRNVAVPHAFHNKHLARPGYSPAWAMARNIASFPDRELMCFRDHLRLSYVDQVPHRCFQKKYIRWNEVYNRRYVYDHFFKITHKRVYSNLIIEKKQIQPTKFGKMAAEVAVSSVGWPERDCKCRLFCLCFPIPIEEYARFS